MNRWKYQTLEVRYFQFLKPVHFYFEWRKNSI